MSVQTWIDSLDATRSPNEADAKRLLSEEGIRVPPGLVLEAGRCRAPEFDGPYAVKVVSASVLHKTESGALSLGVEEGDLARVVSDLAGRFPGEKILVEQMVRHAGVELIVGAFRDADLGPAVMVGGGGVLTELYRDVAFRLLPCDDREIDTMIEELTISPVLSGYRSIALDREGFVRLVATVGRIVIDLGDDFAEIDLNPVVFAGDEWIVLDCRIALARAEHRA